jgi:hypothetical protein
VADVAGRRALPGHPKARAMTHDRPRTQWRQVAGPDLDPRSFAAATIPDGENSWSSSAYESAEARNRALLVAHFAKPARPKMAGPTTSTGGDLSRVAATRSDLAIPDDLSIPDFLKRSVQA